MLKVPLSQAAPGMTLAMPLHHPQTPGRVLLQTGFELDMAAIDRLREIELREVWVSYPSLAFLGEYVNPAAIALQHELAAGLDEAFAGVANDGEAELEYEQFRETIGLIIDLFSTHPRAALYIDEVCAGGKTHIAHAANVCSLSLLMGLRLQPYVAQQRSRLHPRYATNVVNLGVGAMLHDIGMLQLDPETLDRWARTLNENDPVWRQHVWHGYEMVREQIGPSAASIILNHHQRYDGSGFPEKTEGDGVEPLPRRGKHPDLRPHRWRRRRVRPPAQPARRLPTARRRRGPARHAQRAVGGAPRPHVRQGAHHRRPALPARFRRDAQRRARRRGHRLDAHQPVPTDRSDPRGTLARGEGGGRRER